MSRMHSLASSWKKSFSNKYFRGSCFLGVRVFVFNAVSSAFCILDGLGTENLSSAALPVITLGGGGASEIYLREIGGS